MVWVAIAVTILGGQPLRAVSGHVLKVRKPPRSRGIGSSPARMANAVGPIDRPVRLNAADGIRGVGNSQVVIFINQGATARVRNAIPAVVRTDHASTRLMPVRKRLLLAAARTVALLPRAILLITPFNAFCQSSAIASKTEYGAAGGYPASGRIIKAADNRDGRHVPWAERLPGYIVERIGDFIHSAAKVRIIGGLIDSSKKRESASSVDGQCTV